MFVLSADPHSLVEPVVGEDYNTLFLHLIGDKSRLPAWTDVPSNPTYRHGFRLYADGLEPSEKTALYNLPSDFDEVISNYRYGFMYLPGIGIATQAAYPANDKTVFEIICADDSVIWAEGMPTSWSLYGEDGEMEDVGLLLASIGFDDSLFGVVDQMSALSTDHKNFNSNFEYIITYVISWLESGTYNIVVDNRNVGLLQDTNLTFEGSPNFALNFERNGGIDENILQSPSISFNLAEGHYPQLLFASMFVPFVPSED